MLNNKIKALITRPEREGRVLADKLNKLGIDTLCQPMFDHQLNHELMHQGSQNLVQLLNKVNQPLVIFISVAAVNNANIAHNISLWPASKFFAVGKATAQALNELGIEAVSPQIQTSEGLLALEDLSNIAGQDVIIVRGDGGREHLAESLRLRNANVHYVESYQRIWRKLPKTIDQDWRNHRINCMVITSDAILQSIVQLINLSDDYWRTACYWVVVSQRIAQSAKALGLVNVINSNGASDKAISDAIISYETINME